MSGSDDREKMTVEEAGAKGGKARMEKMTPEERREVARRAAQARWGTKEEKEVVVAPHNGIIKLGELQLPCSVLPDGTRVLHERGVMKALGIARSGYASNRAKEAAGDGAALPLFVAPINLKPFVDLELAEVLRSPIWYRPASGTHSGIPHKGIRAEVLPRICNVWLKARDEGVLRGKQLAVAACADIIVRGLAEVGIIALVDEVTGYQFVRPNDELRRILERYISKELARWVHTFQPDFYREMYRLRSWTLDPTSHRKPGAVAKYTINLVYDRIHPDLLRELKQSRAGWEDAGGSKGGKLHQFLTVDAGHPRLKQHLEGVIQIMRFANDWDQLMYRMDVSYPKINETRSIPFPEPEDDD